MVALKALVIFLAVFAFATIGYNAALIYPKVVSAKAEVDRIPTPPPSRALDAMMSAGERQAQWAHERRVSEELNEKRTRAFDRYAEVRDRRDMYSASATGIGLLAFFLSIAATWKKPKGLLVLGTLTAVASGAAWVALTIGSDGHL